MAKIPKFKNDREIRDFWDKHHLSDFEEDLKPAGIAFQKQHKEVVTIRLDRPIISTLKAMAKRMGIGYSSLARIWVMEKIQKELNSMNRLMRKS